MAHFVSKLSDADAEAAETQVWLDFALRCGYTATEEYDGLYDDYEAICAGLVNMMANPEQWCGPSILHEGQADYLATDDP